MAMEQWPGSNWRCPTCSRARSGLALGQRRAPGRDLSLPPMRRTPRFYGRPCELARPPLECGPAHTGESALAPMTVADASTPVHVASGPRVELARNRVAGPTQEVGSGYLEIDERLAGRADEAAERVASAFPRCSLTVVFAPQQPPRITRPHGSRVTEVS